MKQVSSRGAPSSREAIVDAAVNRFLAVGYGATSMEDIARAAGVARRTVFNQFDSKEALFAVAIERMWERLTVQAIVDDPDLSLHPKEGLERIGHSIADFWSRGEAVSLTRLVIAEGGRFPPLLDGYSRLGRLPALTALTRFIASLQDHGHIEAPDTQLAAEQFVALVKDPLWWPVIIGLAPPPDERRKADIVHTAVRCFLDGFAVRAQ